MVLTFLLFPNPGREFITDKLWPRERYLETLSFNSSCLCLIMAPSPSFSWANNVSNLTSS